ncbi:hypothetical protein FRC02_000493 [Tulasnella sp. 418]|nr:hypothetical protein FRC02_000493 [Tulasnella sp. 418]
MALMKQLFLTLLGLTGTIEHQTPLAKGQDGHNRFGALQKSIAIVGGGTGGLTTLKTLLEFTQNKGIDWKIDLFEQRHDVGGVWLPDFTETTPPDLPETPLYPRLQTNRPHPLMTIHGFPYPEMTNLYPSHEHVWQYHRSIVDRHSLAPYIHTNHTVISSTWLGNSTQGKWVLEVNTANETTTHQYDHLIIAAGNLHHPHIPEFKGLNEWLRNPASSGRKREVLHSIYYRNPERYRDHSVVVVGGGASGQDIVNQIRGYAKETFHSIRSSGGVKTATWRATKPNISYLNSTSIIFADGSSITSPDSIILATGYELRRPFLTSMLARSIHDKPPYYNSELSTNLRYIRPLHQHILSLSSSHRLGSLYFVGLPTDLNYAGSDVAQALFVANTISNPSMLPSQDSLIAALIDHEASLLEQGFDPEIFGHKTLPTDISGQKYQEQLIEWLRERGASSQEGLPEGKYISKWRKHASANMETLHKAWRKVESLGEDEVRDWLDGVRTEDQWGDLMGRLIALNGYDDLVDHNAQEDQAAGPVSQSICEDVWYGDDCAW